MNNDELKQQLEQILFANIEQFWFNLSRHKYHVLINELLEWPLIRNIPENESPQAWLQLQSIAFLRHKIERLNGETQKLDAAYQLFMQRLAKADIKAEKELHILNYARELGASEEQLKEDKQAFSRWFDDGAVIDRYQRKVADAEQTLKFLISKLGNLTKTHLRGHEDEIVENWKKLDLEPFFMNMIKSNHSSHIKHSIIRALVNQVAVIHQCHADPKLNEELIAELVELLEEPNTSYLAIVDILEILYMQRPTFIRAHIWALIEESITDYFDTPKNNDSLFILAALPRIISNQPVLSKKEQQLLFCLSEHPYPRVRQALLEQLCFMDLEISKKLLSIRINEETCGAVLFTLIKQFTQQQYAEFEFVYPLWQQVLLQPLPFEVKRLNIENSARIMLNLQLQTDKPEDVFQQFIATLNKALEKESHIALKRYITRAREQLVSFSQQTLLVNIEDQLANGKTISISNGIDQHTLGRVLSFKAQKAEAFNGEQAKQGWQVILGYRKGRRLWRIWHEFFNPSTDKRQSFNHTLTKKPAAQLHVPSCTVAEISETNVPGEALYNLNEHTARPHLPLIDYLLSILSQDNAPQPAHSYTPDGILEIHRPNSFIQKAKAYWHLSVHFEQIDSLRKGNELEQKKFLQTLRELGFSVEFKAYGDVLGAQFPLDKDIAKLFNKSAITPVLLNIWFSFKEYLYSIYQNSISQLVFFVTGFMAYFWGRHIHVSNKIKRNRKAIPVSIGGWGTRGKSGTERLKAALFSSLDLRVIAKTTGCEAMMIYGKSSGEQYEVPLFRPFDKASIWEQSDVLDFARKTKADVFLWECMGLTPRYVRILRRWMRDNFATITNAYPDHEDILGPTGIDVAKEMSAFIGNNTQVFTAEQTMMPILSDAAEAKNTTLIQTHWGEGYQIPPDIRALYPYEEHPDNIALVCKMAQYIGIDKDFVYKETAERIVPDIGVLQHFQPAPIGDISQSFVNSMSANERLATIENWKRLELFDLNDQPHIQTIALINNRNDRIARSKVFAQILAQDLRYDFIVVIGSNVDGFNAYMQHAINERLETLLENDDLEDLKAFLTQMNVIFSQQSWLEKINHTLDVPLQTIDIASIDTLQSALNTRLPNKPEQLQKIIINYENWKMAMSLLELETLTASAEILTETIQSILASKVVLVENAYVKPDQLTHHIAKLAMKNQHQLIVGMQNIKGAGLNYVYMWQQWQKIYHTCEILKSPTTKQAEFRKQLLKLAQQPNFSAIETDYLQQALSEIAHSEHAQNEFSQAELRFIQEKVSNNSLSSTQVEEELPKSKFRGFINQVVESFLDAGAAVKRKKTAQQVYEDIAEQRITIERAIAVLAKLNRSQKPGWLSSKSDNQEM
ncbi:poly-gamma-glutamate synthase PgsB [Pseudoalteromonas phenolica]|uniref:Poly-gamma-glutamate synthase PgsB n=1 Tax=Pseudoalteromonas phenolica TaxID=161398 RepID=A0A4Q7IQT0_9GAMM|nr:poly-gamma-glutamate synthase PgsB [Pseudoalteromonas phenolica]RZQ54803.1 poly-gamma-glutamate synthase PgsB [Pseudoalteromonas phenolica]